MKTKYEDSFYYLVFKDRLNWTGHYIPVKFKDPNTGFYMEGYLNTVRVGIDDDSYPKEKTEILYACAPKTFPTSVYVTLNDIHPTSRRIFKYSEDSREEIVYISGLEDYEPEYALRIIPTSRLKDLFREYPKHPWTIKELESMLNNTLTDEDISKLTKVGRRICMIESEENDVYVMEGNLTNHVYTDDMEQLRDQYKDCEECALGIERKQHGERVVFSRGQFIDPEVFIIGEAPGMQEVKAGIPFYPEAPAGGALDKVMKAAGFNVDECYFTNAVLCRPIPQPGSQTQNGKPGVKHIKICNSRLKNQIAISSPKKVVLLGAQAFRAFFGREPAGGVLTNSGPVECEKYKVYFMPHPSWVVRQLSVASPEERKKVKRDYLNHWKAVKEL